MGDWISVNDRLPDIETVEYSGDRWGESDPVLAIGDGEYKIAKLVTRFFGQNGRVDRWETKREVNAKVTHWMPLPKLEG